MTHGILTIAALVVIAQLLTPAAASAHAHAIGDAPTDFEQVHMCRAGYIRDIREIQELQTHIRDTEQSIAAGLDDLAALMASITAAMDDLSHMRAEYHQRKELLMAKSLTAEHKEILNDAIEYIGEGQLPPGREGWRVLGDFVETCQVIGSEAYQATPALRGWAKRWHTAAWQSGKTPHTECVESLLTAIRETLSDSSGP